MTRSVNYKTSKKTNTSIIAQLNNQHKKRRQRVGNITLILKESRIDISAMSEIN